MMTKMLMNLSPLRSSCWPLSPHKQWIKFKALQQIKHWRGDLDFKQLRVDLRQNTCLTGPNDVHIEFQKHRVTYHVSKEQPSLLFYMMMSYLPAYTFWFKQARLDKQIVSICAGEGNEFSLAQFSPSSKDIRQTLLPDAHFFQTKGFEYERSLIKHQTLWDQRSTVVCWRGSATGLGKLNLQSSEYINQRLRLVSKCSGMTNVDVKIVINHYLPNSFEFYSNPLNRHLFGEYIAPEAWQAAKYAIDIDGNSNTWTNFMRLLLLGCCVLKVESEFGYRQWYYHKLRPYQHYVPVKADLSDLESQIEWINIHDNKAREIAANGQALALQLTFKREQETAIENIHKHLDGN